MMPTLKPQGQTTQLDSNLKETSSAKQLQPGRASRTSRLCLPRSYQKFSTCSPSRGDQQSCSTHLPGPDLYCNRVLCWGQMAPRPAAAEQGVRVPLHCAGYTSSAGGATVYLSSEQREALGKRCLACGTQNGSSAPFRGEERGELSSFQPSSPIQQWQYWPTRALQRSTAAKG